MPARFSRARFWLIAVVSVVLTRAITSGLHLDGLAGFQAQASAPMWLIAAGVLIGFPYAIFAVALSAALGACGGRLFSWVRAAFFLCVLVAAFAGAGFHTAAGIVGQS